MKHFDQEYSLSINPSYYNETIDVEMLDQRKAHIEANISFSVWRKEYAGKIECDLIVSTIKDCIEKVITDVKDILYWVDKENPRGEAPRNPGRDPQFNLWNTGVELWWKENASRYNSISPDQVPSEYETVHTEASISPITVSGISSSLPQNNSTKITVSTTSSYPLTSVDVSINNTYLVTLSNPFNFFFTPKEYGYTPGEYTLKLSATNSVFAKSYVEQKITISE